MITNSHVTWAIQVCGCDLGCESCCGLFYCNTTESVLAFHASDCKFLLLLMKFTCMLSSSLMTHNVLPSNLSILLHNSVWRLYCSRTEVYTVIVCVIVADTRGTDGVVTAANQCTTAEQSDTSVKSETAKPPVHSFFGYLLVVPTLILDLEQNRLNKYP